MMPNRQPRAFFPANRDLVLHDQFADVLESHWSFKQLNPVMLGQRVDQICRCHRLGHAILPPAALYQIVEEQSDDIIRLQESSVAIDNAEAIRVAIGSNANL